MVFVLCYLLIINVIGFVLMGYDKAQAVKQGWRIPERTLFLVVLIGGGVGSWIGMYSFRHKTRHWYFRVGIPAITIIEAILGYYVYMGNVLELLG